MRIFAVSGACVHDDSALPLALTCSARELDVAAAMCQALGDVARLRLLVWLSQREMCVSELVALEKAPASSVSARLKILHSADLVRRRREAKHVFYALADEHVRVLLHNILSHAAESVVDFSFVKKP